MSDYEYLVLGAGMMGRAIAYDLARYKGKESVIAADSNKEACDSLRDWLDIDVRHHDAGSSDVNELIEDASALIIALPYGFNLEFMKKAIDSGCHFCDLGGNDSVVAEQLALDPKAKDAGVLCVPDCGLAPGMANVLGAHLASGFDSVDKLTIRVGGLPQNPVPPLNYQLFFSPGGLINEYKEPCKVLRDGEIVHLEPMTELESLSFDGIGELEAFTTSGGAAWLPELFQGRIKTLDYKTIRYPGHAIIIKAMLDLGLASEEEIAPGITPRSVLEGQLAISLAGDDEDVVLVRVRARGFVNGQMTERTWDIVDRYDREKDITAMMRTTAYPTSIIAQMMVDDVISEKGVRTPEMCVPGEAFISALEDRGIIIQRSEKAL